MNHTDTRAGKKINKKINRRLNPGTRRGVDWKKAGLISAVIAAALGITLIAVKPWDKSRVAERQAVAEAGLNAGVTAELNTELTSASTMAGAVAEFIQTDASVQTDTAVQAVESATVGDTVPASGEYPADTIYGYHHLGFSVISDGNLNVRESASGDSTVVGKLTNHNAVEIISTSEDDQWYQVTSGKLEGFVKAEYIVTGDAANALVPELINTYAAVKDAGNLRVRKEPNTESKILELVGDGTELVVTNTLDGWIEVEVDDELGYVAADYVTLSNKFPTGSTMEELSEGGAGSTRASLVQFALQYVGNRYVWGGTSLTKGVDCSGFTMQVYAHFGISLPHSSRAQPGYGTKIKASEAQPGDLFFYGNGGIGHVGIYIGNGQIVHASNERSGIKISNAFYRQPICVVSYLGE